MGKLIDPSTLEVKVGKYATGSAQNLSDGTLLGRVQNARRMLSARMIAISDGEIAKKIPAGESLISRKIDGEFTVFIMDGDECLTLNPFGTVRVGAPFMDEAHEMLKKAGFEQALVCGELCVKHEDGRRCRVHDVVHHARSPDNENEIGALCYAVFDILELDGKPNDGPFAETWKKIQSVFRDGERVFPVEAEDGTSSAEVQKQFDAWVKKEGAEGLVVRSDEAGSFKVKPRHNIDVAVVGFAEGTDDRVGMLHDMLIAVMREDGSYHLLGRVGGGFSDQQRRDLLSDLKDLEAESEYAEVNSDGVAYRMIKPQMVAEISILDAVSSNTRGGAIDRMVVDYDADSIKWVGLRRMPLASVISPQFVRLREDKKPHPGDVGIKQIADRVEVPLVDRNAKDLKLVKSELISREVFTKQSKGATMVRKLLLWKTNKEEDLPEYPAYVLSYTDFSPNRKNPLSRDVRISNSREQIDELHQKFREKYVLKGWEAAT